MSATMVPGERYRRIAELRGVLLQAAAQRIPLVSLGAQARALALWSGRQVVPGTEAQLALVYDLGVFAPLGDHMRAIDRLAKAAPPPEGSEEAALLAALQATQFRIFRINGPDPRGGMAVTDLATDAPIWLMDDGLQQRTEQWPGMIFGGHLAQAEEFHITCGAMVPFSAQVLERVLEEWPAETGPISLVGAIDPKDPAIAARLEEPAAIPRLRALLAQPGFAAKCYRAALDSGVMGPIPGRVPMPQRPA